MDQRLVDLVSAFRASEATLGGDADVGKLILSFEALSPLYPLFFGEGIVLGVLQKDLIKHISEFRGPSDAKSNMTVRDVISEERKLGPFHIKAVGKVGNRHVGLLWMDRTMRFIQAFLQGISAGDKTSIECARAAYSAVLKPFHSWTLSAFVSTALGVVPSREILLSRFKIAPSDAASTLTDICHLMGKQAESLHAYVVSEPGLDLKDVVGLW